MDARLVSYMYRVFYIASHNGLFAIVDENTYHILETLRQSREQVKTFLQQATAREKQDLTVFVFGGDQHRYRREKWLIGTALDFSALKKLLKENCAMVIDVENEMYVPFSNGDRPLPEEVYLIRRESEFKAAFGLLPEELREGGKVNCGCIWS